MVNNVPTVSEIRNKYQYKGLYGQFLNDHLLALFSPYVTRLFIKWRIVPNQATLMMLLFGLIGAVMFSVNMSAVRIIGVVFIYLWYLMDLVDGEIARITQNFSKYGKEFDYTAHVVDHPAFTMSFAVSVYQISPIFSLVIILIGFLDTIFRALQSFAIIRGLKEGCRAANNQEKPKLPRSYIFKYLFLNLSTFPLFVLAFPLVLFFSVKIAFIYSLAVLFATFVIVLLGIKSWIKVIF